MFQRLANWLNHYDTVTIDGLEWPLQTRRQKLLARLRRGREGLRHPLLVTVAGAVAGAVVAWLLMGD